MVILKRPAVWSDNVRPICLPPEKKEYGGKTAIAAGWGRTDNPEISTSQSPVLKSLKLTVDKKKFTKYKMFGTKTLKKDGVYQDPCSGDSGWYCLQSFSPEKSFMS